MPPIGDQHRDNSSTINPFQHQQRPQPGFTAEERSRVQDHLNRRLGPEYLSSRPGGGQKVWYLSGDKAINLANDAFGFDGWSSSIRDVTVDYVDEGRGQDGRVSLGLSVVVRVTLKDGTYHEDIGYGTMENAKTKAQAFEKAKKEGTTDALKRALRLFGNSLGLCVYDNKFVKEVTRIKPEINKLAVDELHRHSSHAVIKREIVDSPRLEDLPVMAPGLELEDEFGDFDGIDFGENDSSTTLNGVDTPAERLVTASSANGPMNNTTSNVNQGGRASINGAQIRQIPQQMNKPTPQNTRPTMPQQQGLGVPPRNGAPPQVRPGQTPTLAQRQPNSKLGAPSNGANNTNQRPGVPSVPVAVTDSPGFYTARAAPLLQGSETVPPPNAPTFNPHAESPSIRKTAGVDHSKSKPVNRDLIGSVATSASSAVVGSVPRPNFTNPQMDPSRRIGMPGNASPMQNRGSYKPPGPAVGKRASDGVPQPQRPPLDEVPPGQLNTSHDAGGSKKQRVDGMR